MSNFIPPTVALIFGALCIFILQTTTPDFIDQHGGPLGLIIGAIGLIIGFFIQFRIEQ